MKMAKQTIAIIGATGNMGSAIARSLSKEYRILVFSKNEKKLSNLVNDITAVNPFADIDSSTCAKEAGWEADIIIPAVPYKMEKEVAEKIREVSTGKIIISISNPLNENCNGLATTSGTSAAEELQKHLSACRVVKAFNTVLAKDFDQPAIGGKQADVFIAGDDEEAVKTVSELVKSAGFNAVEAGPLSASRILESRMLLTGVNKNDNKALKNLTN